MKQYPLVDADALNHCCLLTEKDRLSFAQVLYRAERLAERLPDTRHCVLLCERRDLFIIGFIAALMRQQTVLLPSNRTHGALRELQEDYPAAYCMVDEVDSLIDLPVTNCSWLDQQQGESCELPWLAADHLAAVVFTSGSTGKPQANRKYWGDLVAGSALLQRQFGFDSRSVIVTTVPPQHMFGLETSVLAPLLSGASAHAGRPFYPADVQQALELSGRAAILVTTPLHLRACVAADLKWPQVQQIISATAPLDRALAVQAEHVMHTRVREVFGCSEAGSFAFRSTATGDDWQMYQGMMIVQSDETGLISGAHLPQPISLGDLVDVQTPTSFRFRGRQSDMLKIAGKRVSLSELNIKLTGIPGVSDGVFVMRRQQTGSPRLMALVAAPKLDVEQIKQALAISIDPVFLPRPLVKVAQLPRNEANKLPKAAMDKLLSELGY